MTETVGAGAEAAKTSKKRSSGGARKGLRIQRVFTTEGCTRTTRSRGRSATSS
ncbi:hypothetical protein ACFSVJ_26100 [Prauserella oleivorans]